MMNFKQYNNVTKIIIPNGVRLSNSVFSRTFENMRNLKKSHIPNTVTSMSETYKGCYSLTGPSVCSDNVTNMSMAYQECYNLTGAPVCGKRVTNMSRTYYWCGNITGSPVCGDKVTNMSYTYNHCANLTGFPICGRNVTRMDSTYASCNNLASNAYFYSAKITNMQKCFSPRNIYKYLNLYLPANSTSLTTALINNTSSMVGASIAWTNDMAANNRYYNTQYNIYIYPVENVAAAAIANGDEEANANAGIV